MDNNNIKKKNIVPPPKHFSNFFLTFSSSCHNKSTIHPHLLRTSRRLIRKMGTNFLAGPVATGQGVMALN